MNATLRDRSKGRVPGFTLRVGSRPTQGSVVAFIAMDDVCLSEHVSSDRELRHVLVVLQNKSQ